MAKTRPTGTTQIKNENDTVTFLAVIERTKSMEADVPSYPTENGFEIADSIIKKPISVTCKGRIEESSELLKLENMYLSGDLVKLVTPARVYYNMAISSVSVTESAELANAYEVNVTLKAVKTTQAKIIDAEEAEDETEQSGETDTASDASVTIISPFTQEAIEEARAELYSGLGAADFELSTRPYGDHSMDRIENYIYYQMDLEANKDSVWGTIKAANKYLLVEFNSFLGRMLTGERGGFFEEDWANYNYNDYKDRINDKNNSAE